MNKGIKEAERWISTREACEYLGVKRHTLFHWIENQKLPARKVGGRWLFRFSEIDEWVEAHAEKCD